MNEAVPELVFEEISAKMELLKQFMAKHDIPIPVDEKKSKEEHETLVNSSESQKEDSIFKKNAVNSIVFLTSEEDGEALNIVSKNLQEFSTLSAENGFDLSIQHEPGRGLTIRLMQTSGTSSWRKTIRLMDNLIEKKTNQNNEMEERFQRLEGNLSIIKREMSDWDATFERKITEQREKFELLLEKEREDNALNLRNLLEDLPIEKLLQESKLQTLRNSYTALNGIVEKLQQIVIPDMSVSPFKTVSFLHEKRLSLSKYLDFLQSDTSSAEFENDIKISEQFNYNRELFFITLDENDKKKYSQEMNKKFQLDDVVGTIHLLRFIENHKRFFMYFAIVDKKIVAWTWGYSVKWTLKSLHYTLGSLQYDQNYRFATRFVVADEYSRCFVQSFNEKVFTENEKVMQWMKNNFNCIGNPRNRESKLEAAFPALYNMSVLSVYESLA